MAPDTAALIIPSCSEPVTLASTSNPNPLQIARLMSAQGRVAIRWGANAAVSTKAV